MRGRIILISGVSGAGKITLVNLLLKEKKNLVRAISFTTRKPRVNEVDGKDYFFIEKKHFLKKVENGELLEFSEVYGDLYGTGLDSFKEIETSYVQLLDLLYHCFVRRHASYSHYHHLADLLLQRH